MDGFLGTKAPLVSDLSLLLSLVLGLAAVVGGVYGHRRRLVRHCPVMAVSAFMNWLPVLLVMIPMWLDLAAGTAQVRSDLSTVVPLFHGVLGGVIQLLLTYTVVRMVWLKQLPPRKTTWLMRIAMGLWLLALLGGVGVYLALYVF
ncbi:MAG: hypothetical protein JXA37_02975 [Chloroflexia bacterium]|nr:hypothetical protein [Chloroflexia bacterium]